MRKLYHFIVPLLIINIMSCASEEITLMSYNIRYDNLHDEKNSWLKRKDEVVGIFQKILSILYWNPRRSKTSNKIY